MHKNPSKLQELLFFCNQSQQGTSRSTLKQQKKKNNMLQVFVMISLHYFNFHEVVQMTSD